MNYVPINGVRMLGVEIALLLLLTLSVWIAFRLRKKPVSRPRWLEAVLAQSWRSVLLVVAVALASRALLLPFLGVPQPRINDEYSYLLMADTFANGRLTNPTPPSYPHFETFHVNFVPTYHSKYGVAQGIALAFGEVLFRQPWIGVYLSTAILCGAICWALQAFLSPGWALLAALLATVRIAPFSYWMNSYWGGSMAALGGALALGSVVRLFHPQTREGKRVWLSVLFAFSLLILATSRPYEGFAFAVPLLIYGAYKATIGLRQRAITLRTTLVPALVVGLAGLTMMGYYNQRKSVRTPPFQDRLSTLAGDFARTLHSWDQCHIEAGISSRGTYALLAFVFCSGLPALSAVHSRQWAACSHSRLLGWSRCIP